MEHLILTMVEMVALVAVVVVLLRLQEVLVTHQVQHQVKEMMVVDKQVQLLEVVAEVVLVQ